MSKALLAVAAGALILAAGCGADTKSTSPPENATIQELISRLSPVMSCDRPYAEKMTGVRADCEGGKAFIEAFPDETALHMELERRAPISFGQDLLVGDTWLGEADDQSQMNQMKVHLGGRIQHLGPTPKA